MALAILFVFSVACALGVPRVKTDHTLSELFRSSTVDFANYKALSDTFPTSEFDVLVVVEGKTLLTPEVLEQVRGLHLELQFAKAVDGVLSIFSMRDPPDAKGYPPPMFPTELPQGEAFDKLAKRALAHPLIGGKLLSDTDGKSQLTLLIISLKRDLIKQEGIFPLIREIDQISRELLEPTGLSVQLAGAPVMQLEIRDAIQRDRLIYNTSGFFVGFLIALAFFRRWKLVLITSLCPAISVLWAIGLLGWLDLRLNTFINVIPPLVMVIAFTDAMHMVFSIRRRLKLGQDRISAAKHAILTVGPACVLTSLTTSTAFLSLTLTDSGLIRTFGVAAAIATLLAFVAVIVLVPTLVVLLFKDEAEFLRTESGRHHAMTWLDDSCARFASWLQPRHTPVLWMGMALLVVFTTLHFQLEPRYRLSDQVPDTKQSVAAAERLDKKLTGAHPVHVMLRWPDGKTIKSPEVIQAISEAHDLLEKQSGVGNVWSVETLRRWLEEFGESSPEKLADYIGRLPEHLSGRFLNQDARAALVTGRLPNLDAGDSVPVLRDLDKILAGLRSTYPDFEFMVTGLTAVSALQSSNMIKQLNRGLLVAVVVVIVLIGAAFRSLQILVLSIVPNLFPIVAAGSVIYLSGGGLEYASVISLTVAFGLAVDDTIHFLNRLNLESARTESVNEAVYQTISRIGPVLVLTTLVLVAGLAVTIVSDLPAMRLFGKLFAAVLAAALIGDMLILPAIVLSLRKLRAVRKEA
ncbi:MAG: efflux RND transporter permease subunit [Methyloligellaceae bacterium]